MTAHRHHHGHRHDHDHDHNHDHSHPHEHGHGQGHNSADGAAQHLHSHLHGADEARREELQALCETFIEGFRRAEDKTSFLRISGIPFEQPGADGRSLKLVDVEIAAGYQVGTATPAFGTPDLVYLPFPGSMVRERTSVRFVYVSLTERRDVDLTQLMAGRS